MQSLKLNTNWLIAENPFLPPHIYREAVPRYTHAIIADEHVRTLTKFETNLIMIKKRMVAVVGDAKRTRICDFD